MRKNTTVYVPRDTKVKREQSIFARLLAFVIAVVMGGFAYGYGVGDEYLISGFLAGLSIGFLRIAFSRYLQV